ncbi:MAG: methylmalonyl-CoA epimerase [Chloroflexota bacterium]
MARKIDHIGVAVNDLDEALKIYAEILGLRPEDIHQETTSDGTTRAAMLPVGESNIELLAGMQPDSFIGKYIAKRGEGIHHIAVGVADISKEIARLKAAGYPFVDQEPRTGIGGHKIAFMHPSGTKVLLELVEVSH